MKKRMALYIILGVVILLAVAAVLWFGGLFSLSRQFELRNGIHFGEKIDTVISKETLTQKSVNDERTTVVYEGTVAGYDNTEVYFSFDGKNNGLDELLYWFVPHSQSECDSQYNALFENLQMKYGTPLSESDPRASLYQGNATKELTAKVDFFRNYLGKRGEIRNSAGWLIEKGGECIKIEIVSCQVMGNYAYDFEIRISYTYFSKDAIKESLENGVGKDL
ncbi:MAG: hypothetical protein IKH77_06585 [Clostridia bacterium]|nr:hypothetical protein [Clostridia bacterium]